MATSSYLRIAAIVISVLAGLRWAMVLVPKQIEDVTHYLNGYRAFKKKLNWLSVSLFVLLLLSIGIDLEHLFNNHPETFVGALAVCRSLIILNVVTMLIHVYEYKHEADQQRYGFGGKQEKRED